MVQPLGVPCAAGTGVRLCPGWGLGGKSPQTWKGMVGDEGRVCSEDPHPWWLAG